MALALTPFTTEQALDALDRDSEISFANTNPHWWLGKDQKLGGYYVDYSYCGDHDCDCYQHDPGQSREDVLNRFADGANDPQWLQCSPTNA